eukprot:8812245-Lingulodinium_polyedra.AAC.1
MGPELLASGPVRASSPTSLSEESPALSPCSCRWRAASTALSPDALLRSASGRGCRDGMRRMPGGRAPSPCCL